MIYIFTDNFLFRLSLDEKITVNACFYELHFCINNSCKILEYVACEKSILEFYLEQIRSFSG